MLTPKQYEAVGRLALAFNEIEHYFGVYMGHLLGTPERGVAELFAEEGAFARKAERFKRVLKVIRAERPAAAVWIEGVEKLIDQAKAIAEERNGYVHALVVEDFERNETQLEVRGKRIVCDEDEIVDLAMQAAELVKEMHVQFGDLLVLVGEMREWKE